MGGSFFAPSSYSRTVRALPQTFNEGRARIASSKKISGPKIDGRYPDRNFDCQTAIAFRVVGLIEEADNSGWTVINAAKANQEASHGLFVGHSRTDRHE